MFSQGPQTHSYHNIVTLDPVNSLKELDFPGSLGMKCPKSKLLIHPNILPTHFIY